MTNLSAADGYRVGIDFGTSTTVAVLRTPDGRIRPLLFDGSELLPSAVCATGDGALLVGRDALRAARANPAGFEPNPKRSVDDGSVLLGAAEVPVVDLFAAVLSRVAAEATRVAGRRVDDVTLTCPAGWGRRRRETLTAAAVRAGLGTPALVAEPVAATGYFVDIAGGAVAVGGCVVVFDFGAGTFDASVVRRTADGFEVLAERGLSDAGGLDIDAAIIAYLGAVYAMRDPTAWGRLAHPATTADRRVGLPFRDDVRAGKELLSRASSTMIYVPLLDDDAMLTRDQLEQLARPILDQTVRATRSVIRAAGIGSDQVTGVFLVGGSSRIPLVATLLHSELGLAPTVMERPELVVAEGSLHVGPSAGHPSAADADLTAATFPAPPDTTVVAAVSDPPAPPPAPPTALHTPAPRPAPVPSATHQTAATPPAAPAPGRERRTVKWWRPSREHRWALILVGVCVLLLPGAFSVAGVLGPVVLALVGQLIYQLIRAGGRRARGPASAGRRWLITAVAVVIFVAAVVLAAYLVNDSRRRNSGSSSHPSRLEANWYPVTVHPEGVHRVVGAGAADLTRVRVCRRPSNGAHICR